MNLRQFWFKYRHLAERLNKETSAVRLLISEPLSLSKTDFYLQQNEILNEDQLALLERALFRYLYQNEPVQYIIGYTYFYQLKLKVNSDVLIPRPETEELVDLIIKRNTFTTPVILDIGTGSGAIALALKKAIPHALVYASDLSASALAVAKENAQTLNLPITFMQGDLFAGFTGRIDILVSNPPYLDPSLPLEPLVKDYEPHLALFASQKGLYFYEAILKQAPKYLNDAFLIAFEIPINHDQELLMLANQYFPFAKRAIIKDLSNRSRMLLISFQ